MNQVDRFNPVPWECLNCSTHRHWCTRKNIQKKSGCTQRWEVSALSTWNRWWWGDWNHRRWQNFCRRLLWITCIGRCCGQARSVWGSMESPACIAVRFWHWALVCLTTLLTRLALPDIVSDADALSIAELPQPCLVPLGILPSGCGRFSCCWCFGLRLVLLGNGFGSSGRRLGCSARGLWIGFGLGAKEVWNTWRQKATSLSTSFRDHFRSASSSTTAVQATRSASSISVKEGDRRCWSLGFISAISRNFAWKRLRTKRCACPNIANAVESSPWNLVTTTSGESWWLITASGWSWSADSPSASSERRSCRSLRGRLCSRNACSSDSDVLLFHGIQARQLPSMASFSMLRKERDGIDCGVTSSLG